LAVAPAEYVGQHHQAAVDDQAKQVRQLRAHVGLSDPQARIHPLHEVERE
jgi:hypothetical protein